MPGAFPPSLVPYANALVPTRKTVYVNSTITGGTGTQADPWVGMASIIKGGTPRTNYDAPEGYYDLGTGISGLAFTATDVTLSGHGPGTIFVYRGTGKAICADGRKRGTLTTTGGPTAGTITLGISVNGAAAQNAVVNYNATAAQVVTAIGALSGVGVGNVSATGGPLGTSPIILTFVLSIGRVVVTLVSHTMTGGSSPNLTVTVNLGDNSGQMNNIVFRDFDIDGNTTAERGIYWDFVWGGESSRIKVRNMAQTTTSMAFDYQFVLSFAMVNLMHTIFADPLSGGVGHMAYIGMNLGSTTVEDATYPPAVCNCSIINCELDSARLHGLWAQNSFSSNFIDGNYTASGGAALQIENKCNDLLFNGPDLENGASQLGLYCDGVRNTFKNMVVYSGLTFTANAFCNTVENGRWGTIGTVTDNGDKNRFIFVNGITAAAIVGTGTAREVYEDTVNRRFVPSIVVTDKNSAVNQFVDIFADTSGVVGNAATGFIQLRSNRSGHVQTWQVGIGLSNFNSLAFFDVTGGVVPLILNENNGGVGMPGTVTIGTLNVSGNLTLTGNVGPTWQLTTTASTDVALDLYSNYTGAGQVRIRFRSAKTAHVQETRIEMGGSSNNSTYLFDVTAGVVVWESFEGGRLNLGASGKNLGFFNAANAAQQVSGANLTNNVTAGGTTDTIADFSDLTTYSNSAAAIRNDIYQLAKKLKVCHDAMRAYGLLT